MFKNPLINFFFLFLFGCIDPIEFDTSGEVPKLTVQGYISNVSFNDSEQLPYTSRYFTVKLNWTSNVSNEADTAEPNAEIILSDNTGKTWNYQEIENGIYYLLDKNFKAEEGNEYKLVIILADGKKYESAFQRLYPAPPIGDIDFEEVERTAFIDVGGTPILTTEKGIEVFVKIPPNEDGKNFYRWELIPSWIYLAELASVNDPNKTCYITSNYYFKDIIIKEDRVGGYEQRLFFLNRKNTRLYPEFTVLIKQFSMSEEAYHFWSDIEAQRARGSIFDTPPYNISSNIVAINSDDQVLGFFQVLHEGTKRWYFTFDDLSYPYSFDNVCFMPMPPASCYNCTLYRGGGELANQKPKWWR
ncbi:MAG: DUF4249 domain-containing protein [Candidatus Cyclobacteriaceae bacterium M2_1C_046]